MNISAERKRSLTAKAQAFAQEIDQAQPYLDTRGITSEVASMFGLGYVPMGQEFGGRLSIPYSTPSGVVQIKYRSTQQIEEGPKYLYEAGLGTHLYNGQVLLRTDTVVITEGELDAMCVQAYVGYPAVAYPGVDTWQKQKHWPLCFEGLTEVIVVADADKVGRETARRVAESIGSRARVVDLPDGYDSNKFIAEKGAHAFAERLQG